MRKRRMINYIRSLGMRRGLRRGFVVTSRGRRYSFRGRRRRRR